MRKNVMNEINEVNVINTVIRECDNMRMRTVRVKITQLEFRSCKNLITLVTKNIPLFKTL